MASPGRRGSALLLLLGVATVCSFIPTSTGLAWDPCSLPPAIKTGQNFTIGFLFLAGGNATTVNRIIGASQRGICDPDVQNFLVNNASSIKVAIFNPVVDRLTSLSIPYADVVQPMANATPPTFLTVAFRGNISSPAAYMASANSTLTNGTGFVVSLALLVRMTKGELKHLQWFDQTCNECGGSGKRSNGNSPCVETPAALSSPNIYACATGLDNCVCRTDGTDADFNAVNGTCDFASNRFSNCSTAINLSWDGSDAKSSVFQTGAQIKRVNAYSLVSLFNAAKSTVTDIWNGNVETYWGTINDQANANEVSLGGGIG